MSVASASPHATNQPHVPTLDSSGVVIEMRLHYYSPQQVAEELSLMDAQLLRRISPKELENGAWMKKDKVLNTSNWKPHLCCVSTEHLKEFTMFVNKRNIISY